MTRKIGYAIPRPRAIVTSAATAMRRARISSAVCTLRRGALAD